MDQAGGRLIACVAIVTIGSGLVYQSCDRASTIYFFEMNLVKTVFIEKYQAAIFPLLLSLFICLVYWTTRRTLAVEEKIYQQKLKLAKSASRLGSRKQSTSYPYATGESTRRTSFSSSFYQDENDAEQARRLKRLLSAIEEHDTVQKKEEKEKLDIPERETTTKTPPLKFTVDRVESLRGMSDPTGGRSRLSSFGQRRASEKDDYFDDLPKFLSDDACDDLEELHDPYQRLIELDGKNYIWSLLSFSPFAYSDEGFHPMDLLSELLAIHIPIWGCVVAFYVVLLEMMNIQLPYFLYYHGSISAYAALVIAIFCGLVHELRNNWPTNNILALSGAYVVISRFQVISYQTGFIFVMGVVIVDLFWFFAIDLLSTCVKNRRAPIFIVFPCDFKGNKEVITVSTFVVPAVFMSLILKYSSMYDIHLYHYTFYSLISAISIQLLLDIFRHIKIPGLVLPSLTAMGASLFFANHRQDLWRFMIKH